MFRSRSRDHGCPYCFRVRRTILKVLASLPLLLLGIRNNHATDTDDVAPCHDHGGSVVSWYDDDCCTCQDCRPVPDEEVEEIAPNVWKHLPTGLIFANTVGSKKVRESKDGRFHVCYRGTTVFTGYCIYVKRSGA